MLMAALSTASLELGGRRAALSQLAAASSALALALPSPFVASASQEYEKDTIGEIPASGIIFKDLVKVIRLSDPKVQGVQIYLADFERPFTDRLQSDFFGDPAQAGIACLRTGKVIADPTISDSLEGEEIFSAARSLLFRSVRVNRLYDKDSRALVYVTYSTRLDKADDLNKARFRTSLCVVGLDDP